MNLKVVTVASPGARSRSLARWDLHTDTSLRLEDAKPLTGGEQRRTSRWRLATWCVVCSLQSPDSHSQVVWPSAELGWPAALARHTQLPALSRQLIRDIVSPPTNKQFAIFIVVQILFYISLKCLISISVDSYQVISWGRRVPAHIIVIHTLARLHSAARPSQSKLWNVNFNKHCSIVMIERHIYISLHS